MKCPKCDNLMVPERFADYEQSGEMSFTGWRCVSCGLILDPTILLHRGARDRKGANPAGRILTGARK